MNNNNWESSGSLGDDIDAMIKKMRSWRYRAWRWWQELKYKIRAWLFRKKSKLDKTIKYSMLDKQYNYKYLEKMDRVLLLGDSEADEKKEDAGMET